MTRALKPWQSRAIDRSLRSVRDRAANTSERFMNAAMELLAEVGPDFTMHDVAMRSQASLQSFYLYFGSKDDLLLALLEEALRSMLERVRAVNAAVADPVERLRNVVFAVWTNTREAPASQARALALFFHRLAETRPDDLVMVHRPALDYVQELIGECRQGGRLDSSVPDSLLAGVLLEALFGLARAQVLQSRLSPTDFDPELTWKLVAGSLSISDAPSSVVGAPPAS